MSIRRYTSVFAFLVFIALAGARALAYDAIVVFGDSYNDVGNIYLATSKLGSPYPPAPYYMGRFSNGPIWIEHVANAWGLPMKPSLAGGTDYAFGGAEVLQDVTTPQGIIPSVPNQVALYLLAHGGKADPYTLYVIEGGGNDILASLTPGGSPSTVLSNEIAGALTGIVSALVKAGGKSFLVPDLLDIGQLPAAAVNPEQASAETIAVNKGLDLLLPKEPAGVAVTRMDVFQTFLAVAGARTHFGFTNVITPCLAPSSTTVCADPAHTLWWDAEHPTVFGHAFFAVLVESRLYNH